MYVLWYQYKSSASAVIKKDNCKGKINHVSRALFLIHIHCTIIDMQPKINNSDRSELCGKKSIQQNKMVYSQHSKKIQ